MIEGFKNIRTPERPWSNNRRNTCMEENKNEVSLTDIQKLQAEIDSLKTANAASNAAAEERIKKAEFAAEQAKNRQDEKLTEVALATVAAMKDAENAKAKEEAEKKRTEIIDNELSKFNEQDKTRLKEAMSKINETDPVKQLEMAKKILIDPKTLDLINQAAEKRNLSSAFYAGQGSGSDYGSPGITPPKVKFGNYTEDVVSNVKEIFTNIKDRLNIGRVNFDIEKGIAGLEKRAGIPRSGTDFKDR